MAYSKYPQSPRSSSLQQFSNYIIQQNETYSLTIMSANPAPPDSSEHLSPAHQSCAGHRTQIPEDLSDIAYAVGLRTWMSGGKHALAELVWRLHDIKYFDVFFLYELESYDWTSHDRDPETIVNNVAVYRDWLVDRLQIDHSLDELNRWFSSCLVSWRHYISIEMNTLVRRHGENYLWFPRSQAQRDAFGYVLFLYSYLRSGRAPAIVLEFYADALRYLCKCVGDTEDWSRET
ncbi:hypothetical protein F4680DRAFT_436756 [Xylaria scruposa]|nr:hypothetical protein F4680DRAFT_436756 [Xylaria scruposa]